MSFQLNLKKKKGCLFCKFHEISTLLDDIASTSSKSVEISNIRKLFYDFYSKQERIRKKTSEFFFFVQCSFVLDQKNFF